MVQTGAVAAAAAVALALLASDRASAQSWQWGQQPGGASAYIQAGSARLTVACEVGSGSQVAVTYRPANIAGVSLQAVAFGGQGQPGDGFNTGYLFFKFDSSSVQQFVRRSGDAFVVSTNAGDVLLRLMRSDNQLALAPSPAPLPVYDTFPLRGSSRSISSALDYCTAPPAPPPPAGVAAQPPAPPAGVAVEPPQPFAAAPVEEPLQPPTPAVAPPLPPAVAGVPAEEPALPPPPGENSAAAPPLPPATAEAEPVGQPLPPAPAIGPGPDPAVAAGPGEAPAGPGVLGSVGDFVAMSEGSGCGRSLPITVVAPDASAFETGQAELQQLIADVQATVTAGCPEAELLRISGFVGDRLVFDGVASRSTLWSLIALALPDEIAAAPAAVPEAPETAAPPPDVPPPAEAAVQPPQPEPEQGGSLFGRPPPTFDRPSAPVPSAEPAVAESPPGEAGGTVSAPAPTGSPGAGITCPAAPDPAGFAAPVDARGDSFAYGDGDDFILARREPGVFSHTAQAGNDVVYVFGGNAGTHVGLGPGHDTLVFCALDDVSFSAAGGDELSSLDSDTDVIIFEPGAFRDIPEGFQRGFFIYSISPINDRIVLRLPPDLEAELVDFERGFPRIVIGDTVIQLSPTTQELNQPIDPAMVIIERVPG